MASRRSRRRRSHLSSQPDDSEDVLQVSQPNSNEIRARYVADNPGVFDPNPRNWYAAQIRRRIAEDIGLTQLPPSLTKAQLLHIYLRNRRDPGAAHSIPTSVPPSAETAIPSGDDRTSSSVVPPAETVTLASLADTVQTLATTVSALHQRMTTSTTHEDVGNSGQSIASDRLAISPSGTFSSHYSLSTAVGPPSERGNGVNPNEVPRLDTTSASLRQQIVEDGQVLATSAGGLPSSHAMPPTTSTEVPMMTSVDEDLNQLWSSAVSRQTYSLYRTAYQTYSTFMLMTVTSWTSQLPPISEDILLKFIAHCHKRLLLKYSTIRSYLCGIRFMYLKAGVTNPWTSGHLLRLTTILNAIKKSQEVCKIRRLPITNIVLAKLCVAINQGALGERVGILMKAVCCVAFFGFLRCGEFTCDTFDPRTHLCINSVTFASDKSHLQLRLSTSKSDPFRKGVVITVFATATSICPVASMATYMGVRQLQAGLPTDPLFVTPDSKALSRPVFLKYLDILLTFAGYDCSDYSGHSFRIGAATSAAQAKIPDHLIQVLGRWSSQCYKRYIRTPPRQISCAHQAMATL